MSPLVIPTYPNLPPLSGDMGHRDELKGRNWSGLSGTWVRSKGMTKGIRSIEYLGCGKEGTCWYVGERVGLEKRATKTYTNVWISGNNR